MPKYELAIAVADETDHTPGKLRKREGDLVAVRPHPWNWGYMEICVYLIVIIESSMDFDSLNRLIAPSLMKEKVSGKIFTWDEVRGKTLPELGGVQSFDEFEMFAKNRCSISLSNLKSHMTDLDLSKVKDKSRRYQPFKSDVQLVKKFDGIRGNRFLDKEGVDTASVLSNKDEEYSIDFVASSSIIHDKKSGKKVTLDGK